MERKLVAQRLPEPVPKGELDVAQLKAIHRHLFQDVCAWAGETRTIGIGKGGSQFQPRRFIETGMADIHRRMVMAGHFRSSGPDDFADCEGTVSGDVNHVHPFRDGNGRTQLRFLKQLAVRAGNALDLTRTDRFTWLAASRRSNMGDHAAMTRCIGRAFR